MKPGPLLRLHTRSLLRAAVLLLYLAPGCQCPGQQPRCCRAEEARTAVVLGLAQPELAAVADALRAVGGVRVQTELADSAPTPSVVLFVVSASDGPMPSLVAALRSLSGRTLPRVGVVI